MLLSQMLVDACEYGPQDISLWEFQPCSNNIFSPLSVEICQMLKPLEYVPDSELPEARAPVHC